MAKVVGIAQQIDAKMDERDISISHRLPGRQQERPIIVRFSRRVGKIELLRKKKKLAESEATKKIKIFEDLTQARSKFLTMMRCDTRIASTWTREGTIFFKWVDDIKTYAIRNLYEGGIMLEYDMSDIEQCFSTFRE